MKSIYLFPLCCCQIKYDEEEIKRSMLSGKIRVTTWIVGKKIDQNRTCLAVDPPVFLNGSVCGVG